MFIGQLLTRIPWALENYRQSIRQVLRPGVLMSYGGLRVNPEIQKAFELYNFELSNRALSDIRQMASSKDFNPNSNTQVASLLYDVMLAEPIKAKGKTKRKTAGNSVDEKQLALIQVQHPVVKRVIDTLWAVKKPLNNISKYGTYAVRQTAAGHNTTNGLQLLHNRWLYKLNPTGTETWRYSSKASDFWIGTQIQNAPYEARAMVEPDSEDYLLWRADLSKADFWHTAFASQEPEMMRVVMEEAAGGLDVHCYHAARFYQKPYAEVYAGYKNKEEWVVHSTKGCRQNSKRIVYGANYLMGAFTLFVQMGVEAVTATAEAMGHKTGTWQLKDYVNFCQYLLNFYFQQMYPLLMPWLERTTRFVANAGNMASCTGGKTRLFFSNLMKDKAAQRELASFYGQGGTGTTITKGLDRIFYTGLNTPECHVNWQLHDELGGNVRKDQLHRLKDIKQAMLVENEANGRKFTIPVELEIGKGWGYRMTAWHEGITVDEIEAADLKWRKKNSELVKFMGVTT